MRSFIKSFWEKKLPLPLEYLGFLFFSLPALFFWFGVRFRNFLYDYGFIKVVRLPRPVISVGNLSVGGTGKTPAVIMLAKLLRESGLKPAILSRGYGATGGRKKSCLLALSEEGNSDYRQIGDEPLLISKVIPEVPVVVGRSRCRTGKWAIDQLKSDILILDDGFQYRSLHRDLDILLIGNELPAKKPRLLPLGNLRESYRSMRRAHIIFLPEEARPKLIAEPENWGIRSVFTFRIRPIIIKKGTGELYPPEWLRGKKVFAFAGIAAPEKFYRSIEELGGEVVGCKSFRDHHPYCRKDVERLEKMMTQVDHDIILTTEKDEMRLLAFSNFLKDVFILRVEMVLVNGKQKLLETILKRLGK